VNQKVTEFPDFGSDPNTHAEIEHLDSLDSLRIEVDQGFESAMREMESIQSDLNEFNGHDLIALCKENVIGSVVSQFGLASLLIDSRDGGAVTTTHNFDKGITSSSSDEAKYQKMRESRAMTGDEWKEHRKQSGYDSDFSNRRKAAFQERDVVRDEYTGKVLPKDGRAHLDHVVSAREIDTNAGMNLHLSKEDRVKAALTDDNLAFTDASINMSKSDHKMEDWMDKTKRGQDQENHERFGLDRDQALDRDKQARTSLNREVDRAAVKKYTSELMATGAKDAANMAYYTAIGIVTKELAEGAIVAVKKAFAARQNGFGAMLEVFKAELMQTVARVKARWKEIAAGSIEAGITAFLSNIVVFLINLFATTLKKFVSMIRAGFVSMVQAFKLIANPPEGMSKQEARFEALKVLTAGVIGALSLGLSAMIEKALQAIPGLQPIMMFTVSSTDGELTTVSDVLAVALSGIAGGLLATIAVYLLDQLQNGAIANKLEIQLVNQSGVVVEYSAARSWISLHDAYGKLQEDAQELWSETVQASQSLKMSAHRVHESKAGLNSAMEKLRQRRSKL